MKEPSLQQSPGYFHVRALQALMERIATSYADAQAGLMKGLSADAQTAAKEAAAAELAPLAEVAQALGGNVARVADRLEKLHQLAIIQNPLEAGLLHKRRLTQAVATFEDYIAERERVSGGIVATQLAAVDKIIIDKVRLTPNEYAGEIRAHFVSLPADKRNKLMGELINQNAGPELAAVLVAPAYLSGFDPVQQEQYRETLYSKQSPVAMVAREQIQECDSASKAAWDAVRKAVREFAGQHALADLDDPATVAKFQAAKDAADRATAEFNRFDAA